MATPGLYWGKAGMPVACSTDLLSSDFGNSEVAGTETAHEPMVRPPVSIPSALLDGGSDGPFPCC